jgi:hypothetical protein
MIFYKFPNQEVAKWQFCKTIHPPFYIFCLIILSAIGPCPWPKLMLYKFIFFILLKFDIETKGSVPADKMYKSGILELESGKILFKSKGRDLTKSSPKVFFTNIVNP